MVRSIGTRVKIEGETEYKRSLDSIAKGLSVLNSELKLTDEKYRDNADSMEALRARGDVLTRQLYSQQEKVSILREQHEKAAKALGESSKTTQDYQIKLNNAERELIKITRAVEENADATKQAEEGQGQLNETLEAGTKTSAGLGSIIDQLAGKLGINLPSGATSALDSMAGMDSSALSLSTQILGVVAAVAALEKAMIDLSLKQAAAADDMMTMSSVTGISFETLQDYDYAAELLDVDVDTLTGSMTKMIRSMDNARKGSKEAADAYKELGIRVTGSNHQLRDANEVFYEAIDKLGRVRNETERDALAMQIFGKSARDLNPLIEAGSARLKELAAEQDKVGDLSEDQVGVLLSLDDAYQRFTQKTEAAGAVLGAAFAPYLEDSIGLLGDFLKKASDIAVDSGLVDMLGQILYGVTQLLPALEGVLDLISMLSPIFDDVTLALAVVSDAITVVANTIAILIASIKYLFDTINGTVGSRTLDDYTAKYVANANKVFTSEGATATTFARLSAKTGQNANGTDNWRGGLTWVGERGPELVSLPAGSKVYSNSESQRMAGGDIFYVTIDAKNVREFNDIVNMAERARQQRRAGG